MRSILLLVISVFILSSCGRVVGKKINGSGTVSTSVREGTGFTEINVSSNLDIYVKQDSSYSIRVVTDDNIQEHIITNVSGSRLDVSTKRGFRPKPSNGMKIYVTGPSFSRFNASGACKFYTENLVRNNETIKIRLSGASDANMELDAPLVTADLSGAGSLTLKGQARTLELKGTGSSTLKCADMLAETVKVHITGAGDAEVFASMKLDIRVTGAGTVKYKGNPSINQKVSGSGSVKKIE